MKVSEETIFVRDENSIRFKKTVEARATSLDFNIFFYSLKNNVLKIRSKVTKNIFEK